MLINDVIERCCFTPGKKNKKNFLEEYLYCLLNLETSGGGEREKREENPPTPQLFQTKQNKKGETTQYTTRTALSNWAWGLLAGPRCQ